MSLTSSLISSSDFAADFSFDFTALASAVLSFEERIVDPSESMTLGPSYGSASREAEARRLEMAKAVEAALKAPRDKAANRAAVLKAEAKLKLDRAEAWERWGEALKSLDKAQRAYLEARGTAREMERTHDALIERARLGEVACGRAREALADGRWLRVPKSELRQSLAEGEKHLRTLRERLGQVETDLPEARRALAVATAGLKEARAQERAALQAARQLQEERPDERQERAERQQRERDRKVRRAAKDARKAPAPLPERTFGPAPAVELPPVYPALIAPELPTKRQLAAKKAAATRAKKAAAKLQRLAADNA